MNIAYAAVTESCTFMLDAEGICRWVVASQTMPVHKGRAKQWEKKQEAAARCIGAQYVASLDVRTSGGLVDMPRVGVPLLFARVHRNGRVSLVRTGPVLRFEDRTLQGQDEGDHEEDDSGMRLAPVDDDERTRPFQAPIEAGRAVRGALPLPPMPSQEGATRLPPPKSPPRRARTTSLAAPPKISSAPPLWSGRRR